MGAVLAAAAAAVAGATALVLVSVLVRRENSVEARLQAKLAEPWFGKAPWLTDYDEARAAARVNGKLIFAYFTPSFFQ